jgi:hypothetical protein
MHLREPIFRSPQNGDKQIEAYPETARSTSLPREAFPAQ